MQRASKARLATKQGVRAEKVFDGIMYGGHALVPYGSRKRPAQANRKGGMPMGAHEGDMADAYVRLLRYLLPGALAKLSAVKDPRKENMCDHSLGTLMLYGLIMFLAHAASRRAANRDMGGATAHGLLKQAIPDIETMPHADTLARLLERIDAAEIESAYEKAIVEFIKSEAFLRMNPGRCLIAVDGTQKMSRRYFISKQALVRRTRNGDIYSVYALESVIILDNGVVLPLFTEMLENDGEGMEESKKQDCEQKAFKRMAEKIRALIGKGRVTIVADGLYASGPVVSICKANGWEFMITLKRGSMPSVWDDFDGLRKCEPDNIIQCKTEGGRDHCIVWSNGIEHTYGGNNKKLLLNIVACTERWVEPRPRSGGVPAEKVVEYAWLSSSTITEKNAVALCNDIARKRWRIENHIHVEKHQGYNYSHCYSYNWNAMKAFHSLMKFAHFMNTLIVHSADVRDYVATNGARWFIRRAWVVLTICGVRKGEVPDAGQPKKKTERCRANIKALNIVQ